MIVKEIFSRVFFRRNMIMKHIREKLSQINMMNKFGKELAYFNVKVEIFISDSGEIIIIGEKESTYLKIINAIRDK